MASGVTITTLSDVCFVPKNTLNTIVIEVTSAIAALHTEHINLPETAEQFDKIKAGFYKTQRFPECIGVIDGCQVKIQEPSK